MGSIEDLASGIKAQGGKPLRLSPVAAPLAQQAASQLKTAHENGLSGSGPLEIKDCMTIFPSSVAVKNKLEGTRTDIRGKFDEFGQVLESLKGTIGEVAASIGRISNSK